MAEVEKKKPKRRLKRSVRRTIGALFLASSLVVAAIPTDGFQMKAATITAATEDDWGTLVGNMGDSASKIPVIDDDEQIYTTGDGRFRFAYVYPKGASSGDKYAVILGFPKDDSAQTLEIPDQVDVYAKLTDTMGSDKGRVAVGKAGNFLYYKVETRYTVKEQKKDSEGNLMFDEDSNPIMIDVEKIDVRYDPCFYEDRSKWQNLPVTDFYYYPNNDSTLDVSQIRQTLTNDYQWIQQAIVLYVGNQYLVADTNMEGAWKVGGTVDYANRDKGVFSNLGNLRFLSFGEHMSGIGDYAFYGCGNLESITFNDKLNTVGVGAFAECINMKQANISLYSNISVIGDYAFYNCRSLETFEVPTQVVQLGNSVFEKCRSMKSIELTGNGQEVRLSKMGSNVFRGCESLESITYPRDYEETVPISGFDGCKSLDYIATPDNGVIQFEGTPEQFATFKSTVGSAFYFRGVKNSKVHNTATANEIAFSFYDEVLQKDVYELTVAESDGKKAVWRVDDGNNLVYCNMETGMATVTIPGIIGPRRITVIDSNTFQDNHYLKKITIPASIQQISSNAFKGCHNLESVIFADGANPSIAAGAFKTQEIQDIDESNKAKCNKAACSNKNMQNPPKLCFVGDISYSSNAFQYAMNPAENINNGNQQRTYITFYSGWPTHLEVRYNETTDKNELVDYPTFADIQGGTKYTVGQYPYMTPEYAANMSTAVGKYRAARAGDLSSGIPAKTHQEALAILDDYERVIIQAALDIVLPEGIESIRKDLFVTKESVEQYDKTISAYSIKEIEDGAFKGCTNLVGISFADATTEVGTYAFEGCKNLAVVNLPATVNKMGLRPFKDCTNLSSVNFGGGPYFSCESSIIYELDDSGAKSNVVQCLDGRKNSYITADETVGVKQMYPEAFMKKDLVNVDLSKTSIETIPEYAFAFTPSLTQVTLPKTIRNVKDNAFKDSNIRILTIPGQYQNITSMAFGDGLYDDSGDDHKTPTPPATVAPTDTSKLLMVCEEGSMAEDYAKTYNIPYSYQEPDNEYTVTFYGEDLQVLDTQVIKQGKAATAPTAPEIEGKKFVGWYPQDYLSVTEDLRIYAKYEKEEIIIVEHTVTFVDDDENNTILHVQKVKDGENVVMPNDPTPRQGYVFRGWKGNLSNITRDEIIYAYYEKEENVTIEHTVTFVDDDESNTVLYVQRVKDGGNAVVPKDPNPKEGYVFKSWKGNLTNITRDETIYAYYEKVTDDNSGSGDDNNGGNNSGGNNSGGNNSGGNNSGGNNNGDNNNGNTGGDNNQSIGTLYVLTVQNGSGSGNYREGAMPVIIANDPASGQEFSHWTISPENTKIASKVLSASVVTMPASDVTVTAHYKTKTSTGGGDSNSSNDSTRPSDNPNAGQSGTTVVIDKNGLSNTGVVSVTVNGSSDNFTIKISESTEATESVLRALMAEYGSDLSKIKYFPMDITLYDATGTKKITDTTGLAISITLPLPDSLIPYAGNNKVAGVVNDRLERLGVRFTTIDRVPCVTFTADHFSPYVIYVDTRNINTETVDETPKTGDGIHPKWFLSVGLACMSMVMFMQKDDKKKKKVSAKA